METNRTTSWRFTFRWVQTIHVYETAQYNTVQYHWSLSRRLTNWTTSRPFTLNLSTNYTSVRNNTVEYCTTLLIPLTKAGSEPCRCWIPLNAQLFPTIYIAWQKCVHLSVRVVMRRPIFFKVKVNGASRKRRSELDCEIYVVTCLRLARASLTETGAISMAQGLCACLTSS